jgi:hypothetical protein
MLANEYGPIRPAADGNKAMAAKNGQTGFGFEPVDRLPAIWAPEIGRFDGFLADREEIPPGIVKSENNLAG